MGRHLSSKTASLRDFSEELGEMIKEIKADTYEAIDRGLDKAMNYLTDKLVEATPQSPESTGLTKESWIKTDKYKNVRYINNNRLTGSRKVKNPNAKTASMGQDGIPVVNLLEFGSKGKPFVRKTVEREKEKIFQIIKGEIENGNTE